MAIANYVTAYADSVPYLTNAEYINAPTAVDVQNLIPGGTGPQQTAALAGVILRASSMADRITEQYPLAASVGVESTRIRANQQGEWVVHPQFWPVIEVRQLLVGSLPTALSTIDLTNAFVEEQTFTVPSSGLATMTSRGPLQFGAATPGTRFFAEYTYVSGWPNTTTTAAAAQSATQIQVANSTGIYPNSGLIIYDDPLTENVKVASTYVGGAGSSLTVPLTAPLANAHVSGVSVSSMPPSIKEAVVSLTSFLIKVRGAEALVMDSLEREPTGTSSIQPGGMEDLVIAEELLEPFKRVR